jgi:hypothetical protein
LLGPFHHFVDRFPDRLLLSSRWIFDRLSQNDFVKVAASRLLFLLVSQRGHRADVPETLAVLREGLPFVFLIMSDFGELVLNFLGAKRATVATLYFASCLVYRWSLNEEGLAFLREKAARIEFQGLIQRFQPIRPGLCSPESQIAILLFASLLNIWRRLVDNDSYPEWICSVVPNIVLPICSAHWFPYDEMSYLSVMESVALGFVQAVLEGGCLGDANA